MLPAETKTYTVKVETDRLDKFLASQDLDITRSQIHRKAAAARRQHIGTSMYRDKKIFIPLSRYYGFLAEYLEFIKAKYSVTHPSEPLWVRGLKFSS